MKGTPIFEEVFNRLIRVPGFWLNLLVGGLLSFVPIVNIFAFGYLYRVALAVRRTGQPSLPEWRDWRGLFFDGLRFAVVWLGFWLLPLLLIAAVASFLSLIHLVALAYILLISAVFVANVLFTSALYRYQTRSDFKDLMDFELILRMTRMELPKLILPSLVFLGISAWLLPFYGFAAFGSFLILVTHTTLRYRSMEQA